MLRWIVFCLLLGVCRCTNITISFGARNIRAAYTHPVTGQPTIVTTKLSSRAILSAVWIANGSNRSLFDVFASEKSHKWPKNVLFSLKILLGKPDNSLLYNWRQLYPWIKPISTISRPYGLSLKISNRSMSIEELVSLQLSHLKQLIEKELGNPVYNCSLVMPPPAFGPLVREALVDAARLAQFHVIDTIDEVNAASNYLLSDSSKDSFHLLIDVGYSHMTASIAFVDGEKKIKNIKSRSLLNVGSISFDLVLRDIIWNKFVRAHEKELLSIDPEISWSSLLIGNNTCNSTEVLKLFASINDQAIKAKEMLSLVELTTITIDNPLPTVELFSCSIQRDEFLTNAHAILASADILLDLLFQNTSLSGPINNVYFVGGGTRMPALVKHFENSAKRQGISGHFVSRNNEECAIFGSLMPLWTESRFDFPIFYTTHFNSDRVQEYVPLTTLSIPVKNCSGDFRVKLYLKNETDETLIQWSAICSSTITDIYIDTLKTIDATIMLKPTASGLVEPTEISRPDSPEKIPFTYLELYPPFSKELLDQIEIEDDAKFHYDEMSKEVMGYTSNRLELLVFSLKRMFEEKTKISILDFLGPDELFLLKERLYRILDDLNSSKEMTLLEMLTDISLLKEILNKGVPRKELYEELQKAKETCIHPLPHIYEKTARDDLWWTFDAENTQKIRDTISLCSVAGDMKPNTPKTTPSNMQPASHLHDCDPKTLKFVESGESLAYLFSTGEDPFSGVVGCSLPSEFWTTKYPEWKKWPEHD